MSDETNMPVERHELVDGLRRAVQSLYNCRYSEVPLARELDGLLKRETGQTYGEWIVAKYMEMAEPLQPPPGELT